MSNYQTGYVYHIKDSYFLKANDPYLMSNKEDGKYRPTYFCLEDPKTNLLWVVPMTTQYSKFSRIRHSKIVKYGTCDTIVLGKYDGRAAAFLIQNMFPITEQYIDHIHTRNNNPVPVSHKLQKEIRNSVSKVRALEKRGYDLVYPDIDKLERLMLSELSVEKSQTKQKQSLATVKSRAQEKSAQQNANLPKKTTVKGKDKDSR